MSGAVLTLSCVVALAAPSSPRPAVDSQRRIERELPAVPGRCTLVHLAGDVVVRPLVAGEKPRAVLDVAAGGGPPELERKTLELAILVIEITADGFTVRAELPTRTKPEHLSLASSLAVWLPESIAVLVENQGGNVRVERRAAATEVRNKLGRIEIEGVRGLVRASNEFGAVLLRDVNGDALLHLKSCEVDAARVSGRLEIRTNTGKVTVAGAGSLDLESKIGAIDVRAVRGDARIRSPFSRITVREVGGSLAVTGQNQPVVIEGVGRDLTLDCKSGKAEARRIGGAATVTASTANLTLEGVEGRAEIHAPSSAVTIARTAGPLVVENSSLGLEIVDPRGDVHATSSGGLLRLRFTQPNDAATPRTLELENLGGTIELELAGGVSAALELTSTSGQIDCALPGMTFTQQGSARTGVLRLGNGTTKLQATCVGGAIRVRPLGTP